MLIDEFDKKILALYRVNTRQSAQQIGDAVGLSAAAVQRRLKRMRQQNVIRAEIAVVDQEVMGVPLTVIVNVDLLHETNFHIDEFKALMNSRKEVEQCWYTTGETDFVLVVRVANIADYEVFAREALSGTENVLKFTSQVVLGVVK